MNILLQFEELLKNPMTAELHIKILLKLMLKIYKSISKENQSFMWSMFHEKSSDYDLRSKNLLMLPQTTSIR